MSSQMRREIFNRQGILILTLVFFSLAILFFELGKRSLWEPDEGRYAEISREMVESKDWLTPRLNYLKHFDKPPITYWLISSAFKLLGQSEFAGRLPLAILGLGGVLLTFLLGQTLFNLRVGFLSAVILISSLGYAGLARVLSTDIIFTFFCLCCYLFFAQKRYPLFYLFMALGFMTKGPVVLMITLLPICVFVFYQRQASLFKEMQLAKGLLLFILFALPWFIYEVLINKSLLNDWLIQQTLNRIVHQREQRFYFFLPVLIGLFFPWIFFLSSALKRYLSFKRATLENETQKTFLLFLWFILPFIFFSCIGKKLVPYILPLLAPLAIITARIWDEAMARPQLLSQRVFAVSFYIFLSMSGIFFAALNLFLLLGLDQRLGVKAARPNIIFLSIILAAGLIVALYNFRLRKVNRLFWVITLTSSFFFLGVIDLLPKIETSTGKSIKALALKIKADLNPEDKVVNYRCFLKSLPFYLARRTIVVERQRNLAYEEEPLSGQDYLLKDKTALYNLLSAKEFKVYCITYTWEWEKMKEEYPQPLYFLGQAGKYVLFVNQKVKG